MGESFQTPVGIASFPVLDEPKDQNGRLKYSITVLFHPKVDISVIEKALATEVQTQYAGRTPPPSVKAKWPVRVIEAGDKWFGQFVGWKKVTFGANESRPPRIVGPDGKTRIDPKDRNGVYAGALVSIYTSVYPWGPNKGGEGVSLNLGRVMKVRDGGRLASSGPEVEDAFQPVSVPEDIYGAAPAVQAQADTYTAAPAVQVNSEKMPWEI